MRTDVEKNDDPSLSWWKYIYGYKLNEIDHFVLNEREVACTWFCTSRAICYFLLPISLHKRSNKTCYSIFHPVSSNWIVSKLEKCYGNYNKSPRFLNIITNNTQLLSLLFFILERKETVSINISIISRHKRNVPFLLSNVNPLISDHVIGNRVTNESGDELERSLDTKR